MPEHTDPTRLRHWNFGRHRFALGEFPLVMGIVNVTPDSFSDGGSYLSHEAAVRHALQLAGDGADVLDIGGESTRPGAEPVPLEEELRRVVPVIERVAAQTHVPISIDTTKADVARAALAAGAAIVNDISGLRFDPAMPAVCRDSDAGVVCMHIQGTPQTMQDRPQYDDVVREIREYFVERLVALQREGIPSERVVLDPGVGFGKAAEHNLEILSSIRAFRELGRPLLIGHSRKRFLKKIVGRPLDEQSFGTIGVSLALALQSVDILRVHDVRATRDALLAFDAVARRLESSPDVRR